MRGMELKNEMEEARNYIFTCLIILMCLQDMHGRWTAGRQ